MSEEKDYPPLNKDVPPDEVVPLNNDLLAKDRHNRMASAVALRIQGANYSEIARLLEYPSAVDARQAVERTLAETVGDDDREMMRAVESRRIERLFRSTFKRAINEKDPEQLSATKVALMLIDRHIKLRGLDAPQQMVVHNPSAIEMQKWIEEASKQIRPAMPEEVDIIEGEAWEEMEDDDGRDA